MRKYDLEDRTLRFATDIRNYLRGFNYDMLTESDIKQLLRSSGSIGANYREANEAISKKDFLHRLRISRKEAKETIYWMNLLCVSQELIDECIEIMKILGAIITKVESKT